MKKCSHLSHQWPGWQWHTTGNHRVSWWRYRFIVGIIVFKMYWVKKWNHKNQFCLTPGCYPSARKQQMTWSGETLSWANHILRANNDRLILHIYSFVEKFNFRIYKLFILGLQSHCLFCKAEMIIKIAETHIDEWQPWDLANNECLVTIFCSSIQSIIKNKTNNKSMYGNIVGGIDLLSTNKTTARSDKLSGSNSWAALAVMLI